MVTAALSRLVREGSPTLGSGGNRIQERPLSCYATTFPPQASGYSFTTAPFFLFHIQYFSLHKALAIRSR